MFPSTIFDFNGVLVDDERVHLAAFQRVLGSRGVVLSERDYWEKYLGYDDKGAFRAILSDAGEAPAEADISRLVEEKRPVYQELAERGLVLFPGASDLVRRQASHGPVGVVSGALRSEIVYGLGRMGVGALMEFVIASEDTPRSKPDPSGYEMAKKELSRTLGNAAQQALVVEDSLDGIEAALGAGLVCVAVAHSYSESELRSTGAHQVVPAISDLTAKVLEDLWVSTR